MSVGIDARLTMVKKAESPFILGQHRKKREDAKRLGFYSAYLLLLARLRECADRI
jgi:hypothetical protein